MHRDRAQGTVFPTELVQVGGCPLGEQIPTVSAPHTAIHAPAPEPHAHTEGQDRVPPSGSGGPGRAGPEGATGRRGPPAGACLRLAGHSEGGGLALLLPLVSGMMCKHGAIKTPSKWRRRTGH